MSSPTAGMWECRHGIDGRDDCPQCRGVVNLDEQPRNADWTKPGPELVITLDACAPESLWYDGEHRPTPEGVWLRLLPPGENGWHEVQVRGTRAALQPFLIDNWGDSSEPLDSSNNEYITDVLTEAEHRARHRGHGRGGRADETAASAPPPDGAAPSPCAASEARRDGLRPQVMDDDTMVLDVVFDGPPGPESCRFVEVEDEQGRSVKVGDWIDRGDGMWALRFRVPVSEVQR